jgi:hypothetical protein
VAGSCEYGGEPAGSDTTEYLVFYSISTCKAYIVVYFKVCLEVDCNLYPFGQALLMFEMLRP